MTREDILTLAKAGFTANQIAALNKISDTGEERTAKGTQEQNVSRETMIPVGSIEEQLKMLSEKIDSSNILNSNQPAMETADDVLASIINPKMEV